MRKMAGIEFFIEDTDLKLQHKGVLKQWIREVILIENYKAGALNFIFCSDTYLQELNLKYLKHNSLTDILTFPDETSDGQISGEIYISWDRVRENSLEYKERPMRELHRVMIHGILHLVGYRDKTQEEKVIMRSKENSCLELLESMNQIQGN